MAAARGARERLQRALAPARHELPAPIRRVTPEAGRMVLQALSVLVLHPQRARTRHRLPAATTAPRR